METEELEYKGFSISVKLATSPENPLLLGGCEPPMLVLYAGDHEHFRAYNSAPENLREAVMLLPSSHFEKDVRIKLVKAFSKHVSTRDVARRMRDGADFRDAFVECLTEAVGEKPTGWDAAQRWFEVVEALLKLAGIAYHYELSVGHCQGDVALVLAMATPGWVELTGAPEDSWARQCEDAFNLYSDWAWGNVYDVDSIRSPEGVELEDGAASNFYGRDHAKSGLLAYAHGIVDAFLVEQQAETEHLTAALCSLE